MISSDCFTDNDDEEEVANEDIPSANDEEVDSGLAIGIDLGTSNSTVAYYQAGRYKYLELKNKTLIPSAIYFKEAEQSKWLYGEAALRRGVMYPEALFKHFGFTPENVAAQVLAALGRE